jgi:hypothetical protein
MEHLARLIEDQPATCTCAVTGPRRCPRHAAYYDPFPAGGDLVPGYADSAEGRADAADQRKADAR